MKLISIDVGIKNLSFCLFDENTILKWDNIDLSSEKEAVFCGMCKKPAKYVKNNCYYCNIHANKQPFIKPPKQLLPKILKKTSLIELNNLLDTYIPNCSKNYKKIEIITLLTEYVKDKCLEDIVSNDATKLSIVTIGRNITQKFDTIFKDHLETIELCIIENQIGPLAVKMKTIQGMISQYFIMRNHKINIEFINASNKLKDFVVEKTDYKERKKLGIHFCLQNIDPCWKPFFSSHKKKDDLADCYLQGLWYIKNNINTK